MTNVYCIARIFGGGKLGQIWRITGGSSNFAIHTIISHDIYKESKQIGIHQSFTC